MGDKGTMHVAEPRHIEFRQLCADLALNGLTNVYAHSVRLGRDTGPVKPPSIDPPPDERLRGASIGNLGLDTLHLLKVNLPSTLVTLLQT